MIAISLNFVGEDVDPDFITRQLNIQPDKALTKGQYYPLPLGRERESSVGKWKLANLPNQPKDERDLYQAWQEFLEDKSPALMELHKFDYKGYLEIQFRDDNNDDEDIFIDRDFIDLLSRLALSISIWKRALIREEIADEDRSAYRLVISQPKIYHSRGEEAHFFGWLTSIKAVQSIVGTPEGIVLFLDEPIMDKMSLIELIALMTRYKLDMSVLQSQCAPENEEWFKHPKAYWYKHVFGKMKH